MPFAGEGAHLKRQQLRQDGQDHAAADAAARDGVARPVDAGAEFAAQAVDLVVPEAGVERRFDDHVGRESSV